MAQTSQLATDYTVLNATVDGIYSLNVRVASLGNAGTFHVEIDGTNVTGTITVNDTGGWQIYQTLTKTNISIAAGVHVLRLAGGSMAHFSLAPGRVSRAVQHRTVSEIWYVLGRRGEMWRGAGDGGSVEALEPGVCLTIPVGTPFQFRSLGAEALMAIAITMPTPMSTKIGRMIVMKMVIAIN
jgi:mannose-6-phosphate isomerase-like protein (cupin superfamily)